MEHGTLSTMSEANGMSPVRRRILIGAASNWLAFGATLVVGFFLTPYLVRRLGDGPYGVWQIVESVLAYFTLFDLGIAASVERFVARYRTTGERDQLNRLVSTCLALFLGLGLIGFAVGAGVLPFVLGQIDSTGVPAAELLAFALVMLGSLAATLPLSVFPATLDGATYFAPKSAVRIAGLALRTVGTLVVLEHRPSLLNLGLLYAAINLLEYAALAALAFRAVPGLRISWRFVNRATVRTVRGYSAYAFLAMLAGRITVQSGAIVIGFLFGAGLVTPFVLALRLVEFAKALTRSATNTLTPAISSLDAAGDTAAIRSIFLRGTRWALYLILPVQVGLVVFGRPFLSVWLGSAELANRSYPLLVILSATLSLVVAQSIAARILYGTGRLKWFCRMALIESAINVSLGVALGLQFGPIGVAVGAAIPNLIMNLWVIGTTARGLGISLGLYVSDGWAWPLLAAAIPTTIWLTINIEATSWLDLIGAGLAGMTPYGVAMFAIEVRGRWRLARRLPAHAS